MAITASPSAAAWFATVERKSVTDLVSRLINGKLRYAIGDLSALPRAAVVVEDRYSQIFKLDWVRPAVVADGLAELQIRWPSVPIVFTETRQLAEEWTYRYLAAAHVWAETEHAIVDREAFHPNRDRACGRITVDGRGALSLKPPIDCRCDVDFGCARCGRGVLWCGRD